MAISKKLTIPGGLTSGQREKHYLKAKKTCESAGWTITEFFNGGAAKQSYLVIEKSSLAAGEKIPKIPLPLWQKLLMTVTTLLVLTVIGAIVSDPSPPIKKQEVVKSDKELRKELIEKQFSAWNGDHETLARAIKASMNNPKSYEHVQSGYTDNGDYILVETKFRGTNAFGGVIMNAVRARVDLQGNILEIISQ